MIGEILFCNCLIAIKLANSKLRENLKDLKANSCNKIKQQSKERDERETSKVKEN